MDARHESAVSAEPAAPSLAESELNAFAPAPSGEPACGEPDRDDAGEPVDPSVITTTEVGPEHMRATVRIDTVMWSHNNPAELAELALTAVVASAYARECFARVDIVFGDDALLADLNERFRSKSGPTNVLAFPSGEACAIGTTCSLGGIALADGVCAHEASERGIPFAHHATHLLVHGLLHLLGLDHEDEDQRKVMEAAEVAILAGLGIPNPYEGQV